MSSVKNDYRSTFFCLDTSHPAVSHMHCNFDAKLLVPGNMLKNDQ